MTPEQIIQIILDDVLELLESGGGNSWSIFGRRKHYGRDIFDLKA